MIIIRQVAVMGAALAIAASCSGSDTPAGVPGESTAPGAPPATTTVETTTASTTPLATATPAATAAPTSPATATPAVTEPAATTPATAAPTSTTAPTVGTTPATGEAASTDWFTIVDQLIGAQYLLLTQPSIEGISQVCLQPSTCEETIGATVLFFVENGLRSAHVVDHEIAGVDYIGTLGDEPFDRALGVNLTVREVVPDDDGHELIDADGNVVQEIPPDSRFASGDIIEYLLVLGRDSPGTPWRIALQGEPRT